MSKAICTLLAHAVVRYVAGDKEEAAKLSSKARELQDQEGHLTVSVWEILTYKGYTV